MTKGIGAWDGSAESFWEAAGREKHTDEDLLLLSDVLRVAMAALEIMERLQALGYGEDLVEIAEKDEKPYLR